MSIRIAVCTAFAVASWLAFLALASAVSAARRPFVSIEVSDANTCSFATSRPG